MLTKKGRRVLERLEKENESKNLERINKIKEKELVQSLIEKDSKYAFLDKVLKILIFISFMVFGVSYYIENSFGVFSTLSLVCLISFAVCLLLSDFSNELDIKKKYPQYFKEDKKQNDR